MKIKKTCSMCGSDDLLFDAYAIWNYEKQEYEIDEVYPKPVICNVCGGECGVNETKIEEDGKSDN